MNIANRDLNLLLLFKILYQERKAVIAAEKLAISQPALSHRLAKLRKEFNDPLFVRSERGLEPTPKAHKIAPEILDFVQELEKFYSTDSSINLTESNETIFIYTTDYMESILLPTLIARVNEIMPKVKIITLNTKGRLPKQKLEKGECDIAIAGFYQDLPSSFFQQKIKQESFKVLAKNEHPFIQEKLTLENYLVCKHVVTTLNGNLEGVVDKVLAKIGKEREVISGISSFTVPPLIISQSDLLLTCLGSIANNALLQFPNLRAYEPPIELPKVEIYQIWHERTHADPVRKEIRKIIKEIL